MLYVHLDVSNILVVHDYITSLSGTSGDLGSFRTRTSLPSVRKFFIFLTSPYASYVLTRVPDNQVARVNAY